MELELRGATLRDIDTLVEFNRLLALETENKSLDVSTLRSGIERVLGDVSLGRYCVAVGQGTPVGQLMITYEWSDWRNGLIWWLQSVYVERAARRQGVFRRLFEHAVELSEAEGAAGIRLYVENANRVACRTYEQLGFIDPSYHVLERLHPGSGVRAAEEGRES
jgi:GNAT superfamily N-acetyltransferase